MSGNKSHPTADVEPGNPSDVCLHPSDIKRPWFDRISKVVTRATGRPAAFITAFAIVLIWGITGPVFGYSDTWQLVINTGTTIVTFLMVFIIQQSQNKDTMAIQLKLNELIASQKTASNRVIDIEDLTERELETLKKFYITLSELAENERDIFTTHSVDEATKAHKNKSGNRSNAG
jgi:low affinity Fe/Cu permease